MKLRKLLCWFGFHGIRRIDKIYTSRAYRISCVDCGKREVMHDDLKACLPWDQSWDDFYEKWNQFGIEKES